MSQEHQLLVCTHELALRTPCHCAVVRPSLSSNLLGDARGKTTPTVAPPLKKKRCTRSSGSIVDSLRDLYHGYEPKPSIVGRKNVLVLGMEYITKECYDLVTDTKAQAKRDFIRFVSLTCILSSVSAYVCSRCHPSNQAPPPHLRNTRSSTCAHSMVG